MSSRLFTVTLEEGSGEAVAALMPFADLLNYGGPGVDVVDARTKGSALVHTVSDVVSSGHELTAPYRSGVSQRNLLLDYGFVSDNVLHASGVGISIDLAPHDPLYDEKFKALDNQYPPAGSYEISGGDRIHDDLLIGMYPTLCFLAYSRD